MSQSQSKQKQANIVFILNVCQIKAVRFTKSSMIPGLNTRRIFQPIKPIRMPHKIKVEKHFQINCTKVIVPVGEEVKVLKLDSVSFRR